MLRPSVKSNVVGFKASEKCHKGSAVASEFLHVFTLLSKSAEASDDDILQDLQEQLSAAERFLTEKTSYSAQRGYKRCELKTRDGLREHLEKLAARVDEKKSDTARRSYDDCLAIFNMADMLFQTFFPLTFQGSTTGKYWGALSKLMKVRLSIVALFRCPKGATSDLTRYPSSMATTRYMTARLPFRK